MTLRFYDSATAKVRDFVPLVEGRASLYYCGATVQSDPHIGHLRSAIVFDQLSRWLRFRGLTVTVVRNVTDIDDKILARAAEAGQEWWARAYSYEVRFNEAYDQLGVARPDYEPRATGHIPEMQALIAELIDKGHAYRALDGSGDVYFDVRSWPAYGSLTRQSVDHMQAAVDADPRGKRDPRDFALWKGYKSDEPESASWDSPWGRGRPGWHLECSAMAGKYLGAAFDIHGGGLDLRFPHHENELAQSQAAGRDFANFWMHNGLVSYRGEKMSKSVGNVVGPDELFNQASPRAVRYYLGQAHYRSVLDFSPEALQESVSALARIDTFIHKAMDWIHQLIPNHTVDCIPDAFIDAMDDDLNVPRALAVLHETVRRGNAQLDLLLKQRKVDNAEAYKVVSEALTECLGMTWWLGVNPYAQQWSGGGSASPEAKALNSLVHYWIDQREAAREAKDWERADRIREELAAVGIRVQDGSQGATWGLEGS